MAESEPPAVVDLAAAFASFHERWSPKIAGQVNDFLVKLAKLEGEFVWHHHEREDELFLVVKGRLTMRLRTGERRIEAGQFLVVPRGVEHCPVADEECWVLLFEPASTLNTGNVVDGRTRRELDRI
jgi:mannose-6-phosphate isomerase-like protein (cupin superfamily)